MVYGTLIYLHVNSPKNFAGIMTSPLMVMFAFPFIRTLLVGAVRLKILKEKTNV